MSLIKLFITKKEWLVLIHDPDAGPFMEYDFNLLKKSWDMPPVADDFFVAFGLK